VIVPGVALPCMEAALPAHGNTSHHLPPATTTCTTCTTCPAAAGSHRTADGSPQHIPQFTLPLATAYLSLATADLPYPAPPPQALLCSALGLPPSYFRRFIQSNGATTVLDFVAPQGGGTPQVLLHHMNQVRPPQLCPL
jgi:hypothetical protein